MGIVGVGRVGAIGSDVFVAVPGRADFEYLTEFEMREICAGAEGFVRNGPPTGQAVGAGAKRERLIIVFRLGSRPKERGIVESEEPAGRGSGVFWEREEILVPARHGGGRRKDSRASTRGHGR